jgi:hypothetical protein
MSDTKREDVADQLTGEEIALLTELVEWPEGASQATYDAGMLKHCSMLTWETDTSAVVSTVGHTTVLQYVGKAPHCSTVVRLSPKGNQMRAALLAAFRKEQS